jgi:Kef-type K+ transport system membrane component KefB
MAEVDTIVQLVLMIVSAWLAYSITSAERSGRAWGGMATVGVYLALFGGLSFGLLQLWSWLRPKLTDSFPSENDSLFAGIIIAIVVVVLALDLWGRIDLMGKMRESINRGQS